MLDGQLPTTTVVIDRASGKLATERTPESYREEIACGDYHTILYYVDPADPLGDWPKDPAANEQFASWESAVTAWMEASGVARCEVPTEEDDVHTAANQPDVRIESVVVNGREVEVELQATAERGISRVEYEIDGTFVARSSDDDGASFTLPSWVDTGEHALVVTAYDDVDNAGSDDEQIDVDADAEDVSVSITSPVNGQDIEKAQTTYLVVVEVDDVASAEEVELRIESVNGSRVFRERVENPSSPFVTFTWTLPEEGDYVLSATVEREDGDEEPADDVRATVTDQLDTSAFDLAN